MGRRQLHRRRHLLGTRSSAHQDEGSSHRLPGGAAGPGTWEDGFLPGSLESAGPLASLPPSARLQKFDELLQLASRGQHAHVDMLVRDVYGGAHQTLGLSGNLIASSFGKSATADGGTRPAGAGAPGLQGTLAVHHRLTHGVRPQTVCCQQLHGQGPGRPLQPARRGFWLCPPVSLKDLFI